MKEQTYEQLLRFYPADYRRRRGDEMLATLLDAADAGRRPSRREVASLAVNGLRVRLGVGGGWPAALRLAALVLVCRAAADAWSEVVVSTNHQLWIMGDYDRILPAFAAVVAALLLLARGSYRLGLVAVAIAFATTQWALTEPNPWSSHFWQLPLAAVLVVPLLRHRPPLPRRPARWLLGVPIAIALLPPSYDDNVLAFWAAGAAVLALSIVDARVAITAVALLTPSILPMLGDLRDPPLSYLVVAVPLAVAGTHLMRRQVKL